MSYKKKMPSKFETEEQEAEYWDKHSPLEVFSEPGFEELRVKVPKDRPITIRLDSESRVKLNRLANERRIGPSTLARLVIMDAIEQPNERQVSEKQMVVQKAMKKALDGNWQAAISLVKESVVSLPDEHHVYMNSQIEMIWLCIQKVSVKPLLVYAENSVRSWYYDEACRALKEILDICEAVGLPLSYEDFSTRIVRLAHATCEAAKGWKGDVDDKLNRIAAELAVRQVEESTERLIMKASIKQIVGRRL